MPASLWPSGFRRLEARRADQSPAPFAYCPVYISPLMISELKRMVESSDIVKCVDHSSSDCALELADDRFHRPRISARREDDAKWPKKNAQGKQELEIRVGSQHVSFEVHHLVAEASWPPIPSADHHGLPFIRRRRKSVRWWTSRTRTIRRVCACSTTWCRTSKSAPSPIEQPVSCLCRMKS